MPAYRHYRFDGAGGIVSAEWIEASDESEVVDLIRDRKLPVPSEVWDGERLVARIDPAGP